MASINDLSSQLETCEQNLKENITNIQELDEILSTDPEGSDDPVFVEAAEMKELLETQKRDTESQIASLKDQIATLNKPSSPPPPPAQEDTPKPGPAPSITEAPRRVFKVNELVSARYAADRQWYPATIVSVQGSSAAPIYTVTFKGYTGNETIRGNDIRPINPPSASSQKRKAETIPSSNPAPPPPPAAPFNNGTVFSAPPAIDSALAEALRNGDGKPSIADGADKPAKRKKPRGDKSLENSKQNWQKWQTQASKGKIAKVANKESMFKLSDKPGARVGFSSAGTMTKGQDRARHDYKYND